MNINSATLSFNSNKYSNYQNQINNGRTRQPNVQRNQQIKTPEYDEFRRAKQKEIKRNRLMAAYANRILGAITALAIAGGAQGIIHLATPEEHETINTFNNDLAYISEYTDIPENIFKIVNDLSYDEEIGEELILPQVYNGTQEKIDEYKEKLANEDLSEEKRIEYEENLAEYERRKEKQDKMGAVYIDPTTDTAYIKLNDTYLAEEVKDAWGIRHGILRKYNEEIKHIGYTSCGETGSQKDYTNSTVKGTIHLPAKELDRN